MAINGIVQYTGGFLLGILLFTQAPILVWFDGTIVWYVCMVITYSKIMDQPGKVANRARGQLNRENEHSSVSVRA